MKGDKKYFAFVLVFLTISGVWFYHFIHLEKLYEIESLNAKISQNNAKIIMIKKFKEAHKNIDEEVSELSERHYRIYEAFPDESNNENIIEYLTEEANGNKLEILNLDTVDTANDKRYDSKNNEDKNYSTSNFILKVRGNYFNVCDFMIDLYNYPKFIDVKSMDLKNNDGTLTLNLNISCYYSSKKNNTIKR